MLAIALPVALLGPLVQFLVQGHTLTFESFESKTLSGGPVFNSISLTSTSSEDVWRMRQTHDGRKLHPGDWDELTLKVDKTVKPFRASYAQFKNGKEVEYRASCFMCHSNGPRLIRPNYESAEVSLSALDYAAIALWNLKIKTYGEVVTPQNDMIAGKPRKLPLKYESKMDSQVLRVATCMKCHSPQSLAGRSMLQRQQAGTIRHLVDNGIMPPFPYSLTDKEAQEITDFIDGF